MSEPEVFMLIAVALGLCFVNWRTGILLCVLIGFLQDPMRKIVPSEPVYLTALVGGAMTVTFLGAQFHNVRLSFKPIHAWNNSMRTPITLFIGLVLIQSVAGFIRTGSVVVAIIGILAYLSPMPAILLGYQFGRTQRDVTKLITLYVFIGIILMSGVYLSHAGLDWRILKQVGEGLVIYDPKLGKILLFSGFLRTPETAAWHGATVACFIVLLSLTVNRKVSFKLGAGAFVLFVLGALVLTGRRKFLVEFILFVAIYMVFLLWFSKTIRSAMLSKAVLLFGGLVIVASTVYLYVSPEEYEQQVRPYYERGVNVQSEASGRLSDLTINSFQYVIERNGILGSGAGTGSQGSQYFRQEDDIVGGAAEGGLGKALAELGVPGLVLILWLSIAVARYLWSIVRFIKYTKDLNPELGKLIFGLMAFLITNGMVYLIAHQVYGDPFVLILLGLFLGFVIGTPKMHVAGQAAKGQIPVRPIGAVPVNILQTMPPARALGESQFASDK
ncbi:MAG TPA: O-antigen ligase family protein [Blastocatellia bacterium]|nr:O-antigen ligase family protein [Blastocatellia bacterium]